MSTNSAILTPGTGSTALHCVDGKQSVSGVDYFMNNIKWANVFGFEKAYQISDTGIVRSIRTGRIRKPQPNQDGYLVIVLSYRGKKLNTSIHRLVASHFIDNPNGYPMVNHKDFDKANNHYENLEWCTHLMNMQHAFSNRHITRNGTSSPLHRSRMKKLRKKIYAYDKKNKVLLEFDSHKECAAAFGLHKGSISSGLIMGSRLQGVYSMFHETAWQQFKTENNL